MNRLLLVPAGGCVIAFGVLLASLHGATDEPTAAASAKPGGAGVSAQNESKFFTRIRLATEQPNALNKRPLSDLDAQKLLSMLADEYLQPWRQWASSPRHLYSRAAPRPIPTMTAEVVSPNPAVQTEGAVLGSVVVKTGEKSQVVPYIVDRTTKQVRLFIEGQWIPEEEWLKKAPLPN